MKSKGMIEFVVIPVIILVASILIIIFDFFYINLQTATAGMLNPTADAILTNLVNSYPVWDQVMLVITIGMFLVVVISGLMIETHPIMFIASLFTLFIVLLISPVFSNLFFKLAEHPQLTSTVNNFPMIVWIFQYLPVEILAFGILALAAWYPRRNNA